LGGGRRGEVQFEVFGWVYFGSGDLYSLDGLILRARSLRKDIARPNVLGTGRYLGFGQLDCVRLTTQL